MNLINTLQNCPYCNAAIELLIDPQSHGVELIEDCQVCCQPIRITASIDPAGELADLQLLREDD
ncbi:MAG: CPXCG motif-containing cysteine-rich protein [Nevskiales bacterium]